MMFRMQVIIALSLAILMDPLIGLSLDRQTAHLRSQQIERLTKVERNQLDRNIQEFESLSNDQKNHYRQLHQSLVEDKVSHAGSMYSLMQTYCAWVRTLSPVQQHELESETDVSKKMVLVRRFKDEQEHRLNDDGESGPERSDTPAPSGLATLRQPGRLLSLYNRDLEAVMKLLVADLPPGKRRGEYESPRVSLYCQIVTDHSSWKGDIQNWPDEEMFKRLKKVLSAGSVSVIEHSSTWNETERMTFIRLLLMGIYRQSSDPVRKVTDEERAQTAEQLSVADQDKLKRMMSSDRKKQFLNRKYFELKGDDSFKRSQEVRDKVIQLFEQFDVPLPKSLERAKQSRSMNKG